ncbi:MAG: type II secretion system F family protein [Fimbriimonadaceae bacterium]|nr:type II secretion system F family protein [Fimbriimonadaceae bacterium]
MARRQSPLARLEKRYEGGTQAVAAYRVRDEQFTEPFFQRILRPLTERSAGLLSKKEKQDFQQMLAQAGYPGGVSVRQLAGLRAAMILGFALIALLMCLALRSIPALTQYIGFTIILAFVMAGAIAGYIGLTFILRMLINRRRKQLQKTLPDVLDLITIAVEAGLGFDAAMDRVGQRYVGAMGEELVRTNNDIRMGRPWNDAMKDLAARTGVDEVASLVTALIQAKELGVNLGNVLRAQSLRLREERARRAREKAQKAPTKLMIPLILFIFPTLFIVLIGPAALRAAKTLKESNPFGNKVG